MDSIDDKYIFLTINSNPSTLTLPPKSMQTRRKTTDSLSFVSYYRPSALTTETVNLLKIDCLSSLDAKGNNNNTIAQIFRSLTNSSFLFEPNFAYSYYLPENLRTILITVTDEDNNLVNISSNDKVYVTLYLDYSVNE